jgi:glycosyltransferase involved in cell wall biosynthesis
VSRFELDDLRRVGARRIALGYHSVDTEFYRPAATSSSTPRAVTVAQLGSESIVRKGIDLAVAATAIVRQAFPSFELDVVGPIPPDGAAWLEAARERLNFDGVNVLGELPRAAKRDVLQRGWLYVQASRYEAFGVAMVEAMACGAVPVHSSGGALPEVAGGAGAMSRRTPEGVAEAIVDLLSDEPRRQEMAARARTRALDFSREKRAALFSSVLSDIGCLPTMA